MGKDGVLVVGSDTQRGFSRLDQVRLVLNGGGRREARLTSYELVA